MNLGIKGKKVLITGAGRGLGEAMARSLADEGGIIAMSSRTKKDLDILHAGIGGAAAGHITYVTDLTEEGAPKKLIELLKKEWGMPDIVVNNLGGTLELKDPFLSINDWRKLWRFNMEVAIEIDNLVIPMMQKKQWGRIVNISSISSLENQGTVPYCSIKAALTAYSRSMGRVLAKDGIIMTAVLPGAVLTKGGYWDITSKKNPQHIKKYLEDRMAIGRFGTPEEIASMVTFLSSELASFCVGTAVMVDGGQGRTFYQ